MLVWRVEEHFIASAAWHFSIPPPPKMEPHLNADLGEGMRTDTSLLLSPQDLFSKKQQLLDSTGDELRALGSSPPQWVGRQEKSLFRLYVLSGLQNI